MQIELGKQRLFVIENTVRGIVPTFSIWKAMEAWDLSSRRFTAYYSSGSVLLAVPYRRTDQGGVALGPLMAAIRVCISSTPF